MKTKALISFAVTAKLICVFVFAYAKIRFSHDEAQFISNKVISPYSAKKVKKADNKITCMSANVKKNFVQTDENSKIRKTL